MKHSLSKTLWGIAFIILGAIYILDKTNILPQQTDIINIIIIAVGCLLALRSLFDISAFGFYAGVAIAYYPLSKITDLPFLQIYVLAIAVFLLSIGTSLILPSKLKYSIRENRMKKHKIGYEQRKVDAEAYENPDKVGKYQNVENNDSENYSYCKNTFGATSKYITLNNLQGATLDCSFGELKAYFDGSVISNPPIDITVHCSFGSIELYIPKEWKVNPIANVTLGNIEEKNRNNTPDGPIVNILGTVSFGSVEIIYI